MTARDVRCSWLILSAVSLAMASCGGSHGSSAVPAPVLIPAVPVANWNQGRTSTSFNLNPYLTISADGKTLLSNGDRLFDISAGTPKPRKEWPEGRGGSAAYSPNGKYLVTMGDPTFNPDIKLWDIQGGDYRLLETINDSGTCGVAFSRDSRFFATNGGGERMRIWELIDGKARLYANLPSQQFGHSAQLLFSNKQLVLHTADPSILRWNIAAKPPVPLLSVETGFLLSIPTYSVATALSPDERLLAVGGREGQIHLYDVTGTEPKKVKELLGHGEAMIGLAFMPDGQSLVSASFDGIFCAWDLRSGERLHRKKVGDQLRWLAANVSDAKNVWVYLVSQDADLYYLTPAP